MADVWIQVMTRTEADRARLAGDARVKMATEDTVGCETLIAREPEYAALRNDAAALYMELGEPARALTHFSTVSRLQPRSARARYNVAVALEALGRTSDAAPEYEAAIRLDPRYSLAHNNLGSLLFSAGRLADARAHFERAVDTGPANAEAHNNLGAALLASGDASAARPHLERAVALRPIYAEAHFNLARAFAAEGRFADALRAATRASEQASAAGKAALLAEIADGEAISLEQVVAVGEGANDIPMLNLAGMGIAYRAKPLVRRSAGQAISSLGLDGLLYLIGVRDRDLLPHEEGVAGE